MYIINKRLIDVLGTDLCERMTKYCDEEGIDEYVFIRGAIANAMGLEHVPEHYKPVELPPIVEDIPDEPDIVSDEQDIVSDEQDSVGDDENV